MRNTDAMRDQGTQRIAGVELGGTKCIVVLSDERGTIVEQHAVATQAPAQTLDAITAHLARWWDDGGFDALGIASFGPLDLDPRSPDYGTITTTPKPGWRNAAVLATLTDRFDVPVAFDTDVNGAALAEGRWGAARGLSDYAYVTVGTGVGVGLIVNGAPTRGIGHCEAGHMRVARLPHDDWAGACPYHGACVEGLAAGPAIAARTGVAAETLPRDHPVWDSVVEAVAQMLQALAAATGPRRFLVGGGVLGSRPDLVARIDARLRALVGEYLALPPADPAASYVSAPGLGTAAGPLGPIALALSVAPAASTPTAAQPAAACH
jgi:fructokinase